MLAALAGADPAAARALITDLLSIAGISTVGGRTVSEIAERFLEQSSLEAGAGLSPETAQILSAEYLAISGTPDEASARMRALAADAGIDMSAAIDVFDRRSGFLTAYAVDLAGALRFSGVGHAPGRYGAVLAARSPGGRLNP